MSASQLLQPVAIVGIACRFPGGITTPEEFWSLLIEGKDAIGDVPIDRWDVEALYHPDFTHPGKVSIRQGGFVTSIADFDSQFFGISPREVVHVDPQQRLLLEVSQEALENAGIRPSKLSGSDIGVYVGISTRDYPELQSVPEERNNIGAHSPTGGALSIAANRISYYYNFKGPSIAVDTACSSALVALHLAFNALNANECSIALVGGVNALLKPETTMGFSRGGFLSSTGRCHSFDASADGYVRSEGAGMVVLKPLSQAESDGDNIICVIKATGVNQDGRTDGITLPNESSQIALMEKVYSRNGINPAYVGYVEAHGTGTPAGDPIEARALGTVLSNGRDASQPCYLGSVKSNIGHLEAGSGIAGLIKLALSLKQQQIPPSIHFNTPNPNIPFDDLNLRVVTDVISWPKINGKIIGAINSFGFGGTNAHAVLECSNDTISISSDHNVDDKRAVLLSLSAHSNESLNSLLSAYINMGETAQLRDIAWSTIQNRDHNQYRVGIVARTHQEWKSKLQAVLDENDPQPQGVSIGRSHNRGLSPIAFIFSGQGAQWWAMGRQLLGEDRIFRESVEEIHDLLAPYASWKLMDELTASEEKSRISETQIAQPAIFALQVALSRRWMSLGIKPAAVVGHSIGEVAACVVSGALSLSDGVRVIFHRSRVQQRAEGKGRMLAVALTCEQCEPLITEYDEKVSIAAINSPTMTTLSGNAIALETISAQLEQQGIFNRFLRVTIPFHSHYMDPLSKDLSDSLAGLLTQKAKLSLYSTVTGQVITGTELNNKYWCKNVRQPVLYHKAIKQMIKDGYTTFVEISAHPVLKMSTIETLSSVGKDGIVVESLIRKEDESEKLLHSLAKLYVAGYSINPATKGKFVHLPNTIFQRQRYWLETEKARERRIGKRLHPFVRDYFRSADNQNEHFWVIDIDKRVNPYLDEHRVQGPAVFPAAGFIELLLSCKVGDGENNHSLRNFIIDKALFLADGIDQPEVRIELKGAERIITISSLQRGDTKNWFTHVTAQLSDMGQPSLGPVDIEEFRQRCIYPVSAEKFYQDVEDFGLFLGPKFQGIKEIWGVEGKNGLAAELLFTIEVPESLKADASNYRIHPAILDTLLQSPLAATRFAGFPLENTGLYLPTSFRSLSVYESPNKSAYGYVKLYRVSLDELFADLYMLDESGNVLVECRGALAKHLNGTRPSTTKLMFDERWIQINNLNAQEYEITDDTPEDFPIIENSSYPDDINRVAVGTDTQASHVYQKAKGSVLLITSPGPQSARLVSEFHNSGATIYQLEIPSMYSVQGDKITASVEGDIDFISQTLSDIDKKSPLRLIVHMTALDTPDNQQLSDHDFDNLHRQTTRPAMAIMRAIATTKIADNANIVFATAGAHAVGDKPTGISLAQAPFWGLVRVIMNEYPNRKVRYVDIPAKPTEHELNVFLDYCFEGNPDSSEIAIRESGIYVCKIHGVSDQSRVETYNQLTVGTPEQFILRQPEYGVIDSLKLFSSNRRQPRDHEVEVRVSATGLNFRDLMLASGLLNVSMSEGTYSRRNFGLEISGVVTGIGKHVVDLAIGDEIIAASPGGFSLYAYPTGILTKRKPLNIGHEEAAGIPIVFATAYYCLVKLAKLQRRECVLIHSAAGGVGQAAIQIARWRGANIIATAGSKERIEYLQSCCGVKHVLNSRSNDFNQKVLEITDGIGVNVILNSLSGDAIYKSIECLAPFGRFIEIGKTDIYKNNRLGLLPFRNNLSYFAFDLDKIFEQQPKLGGVILDEVTELFETGVLKPLSVTKYDITNIRDAFQDMSKAKYIGKLIVTQSQVPQSSINPPSTIAEILKSDRTYLVTGGSRGFGLEVGRWLLSKGAKNLVLMSRTGSNNDTRDLQKDFEGSDITIYTVPVDVANSHELHLQLKQIRKTMPPLAGVVHAAMVLSDSLIEKMEDEQFTKVMKPKAAGALNLHNLTINDQLDFFLMFSSVATAAGNPGQGNYSSANAFLESLSYYRRTMGLPATTIRWGVIGEMGFVARNQAVRSILVNQGWIPFSKMRAIHLLEQVLIDRPITRMVASANWSQLSKWIPAEVTKLRMENVLKARTGETDTKLEGMSKLSTVILNAAVSERKSITVNILRKELEKVLGAMADSLPVDIPVTNLGIDSLMATQITNWIKSQLDVELPIMSILRGPCIEDMAMTIIESLENRAAGADIQATLMVPLVKRESPSLRLICFPYLGGDITIYKAWADALPVDIELYVVPLPLPQNVNISTLAYREELEHQLELVADEIAPLTDCPFVIYGHSVGATMAFDVTKQLKTKYNKEPKLFCAGASKGPSTTERSIIVAKMSRAQNEDEEDWLKRWLKDYVGIQAPTDVDIALTRVGLDYCFNEQVLTCPVIAVRGKEDRVFDKEHAFSWKNVTTGSFQYSEVDGAHLFIESPVRLELLDGIINLLNRNMHSGQVWNLKLKNKRENEISKKQEPGNDYKYGLLN